MYTFKTLNNICIGSNQRISKNLKGTVKIVESNVPVRLMHSHQQTSTVGTYVSL